MRSLLVDFWWGGNTMTMESDEPVARNDLLTVDPCGAVFLEGGSPCVLWKEGPCHVLWLAVSAVKGGALFVQ